MEPSNDDPFFGFLPTILVFDLWYLYWLLLHLLGDYLFLAVLQRLFLSTSLTRLSSRRFRSSVLLNFFYFFIVIVFFLDRGIEWEFVWKLHTNTTYHGVNGASTILVVVIHLKRRKQPLVRIIFDATSNKIEERLEFRWVSDSLWFVDNDVLITRRLVLFVHPAFFDKATSHSNVKAVLDQWKVTDLVQLWTLIHRNIKNTANDAVHLNPSDFDNFLPKRVDRGLVTKHTTPISITLILPVVDGLLRIIRVVLYHSRQLLESREQDSSLLMSCGYMHRSGDTDLVLFKRNSPRTVENIKCNHFRFSFHQLGGPRNRVVSKKFRIVVIHEFVWFVVFLLRSHS